MIKIDPVVTDKTPGYPIQPKDIDASDHLWNAFDHMETETSAGYIVRMCQLRGGWVPFTREEIEEFYQKAGRTNYSFNRLVDPGIAHGYRGSELKGGGWVVCDEAGTYRVTHEFITRCFKSAPASPKEA
jgi:hypothetical protein